MKENILQSVGVYGSRYVCLDCLGALLLLDCYSREMPVTSIKQSISLLT